MLYTKRTMACCKREVVTYTQCTMLFLLLLLLLLLSLLFICYNEINVTIIDHDSEWAQFVVNMSFYLYNAKL